MKKLLIYVGYLFVFSVTILYVKIKNQELKKERIKKEIKTEESVSEKPVLVRYTEDIRYEIEETATRSSVTFIMGEDGDADNPYYKEAEAYYRSLPSGHSDIIITEFRSLLEIRDYLENNPPDNGQPWGDVNIVVHSNEWKGIGMSLFPGEEERLNSTNLQFALDNEFFLPLEDQFLDGKSQVNIQGCALGKNPEMLEKLSLALGGKKETPLVSSSKYFISYMTENGISEKYFTEFMYGFFKTGYRPADFKLAQQLQERYPETQVNFKEALSRKTPRFPGDSYHYFFNIPVEWTVVYEDEKTLPEINGEENILAFISQQKDLVNTVAETDIPLDKFRWQLKKVKVKTGKGQKKNAIRIKGKSSVLCILKSITKDDTTLPFIPDKNDDQFFTIIN